MTAKIVRFPGAGSKSPIALPSRAPSARCGWRRCVRRAWYALEVTGLGDGSPELLCSQHLDLALQQSVVAPGDLLIQPLVVDRSCWPVARAAWQRERLQRLYERFASVGITEEMSA